MGIVLNAEVEAFVTAHALMSLVGLGSPTRLSILIGVEEAIDVGLLKVDDALLDRNEDGYLPAGPDKEAIIERITSRLHDESFLRHMAEVHATIVLPEFIHLVETFMAGEDRGPYLAPAKD